MRRRNMYYLTGLPGWMRFGYSPGWVGRSPTGLGPAASFLLTGQWPTAAAQAAWQGGVRPAGFAAGAVDVDQQRQFLQQQAELLKAQLEQINARLAELEKSSESK